MKNLEEIIAMREMYVTPNGEACAELDGEGVCDLNNSRCPGKGDCPVINIEKAHGCIHAAGDGTCNFDQENCVGTFCDNYQVLRDEPKEGRKYDAGKLRYDLVPWDAFDEIVKRFTHGAKKYAPDNWKKVPDAESRYRAALMRHFSAYCQGERDDPDEAGLSHIGAVAWNALVLIWFEIEKNRKDEAAKLSG
jgi:hypothetical protein